MDVTKKPLMVNSFKLSQPMGASLAFMGIKNCLPLMHGAQGCASFTKEFFINHFNKPMTIYTTSVNDISTVLDGGDFGIKTAVTNIIKNSTPELIGIFSTGLTETKGDDLKGIASVLEVPCVWLNTPDFEGSFESGWANCVSALIEQLSSKKEICKKGKILLLPHASMGVLELENIKQFVQNFGLEEIIAIPDIASAFDGLNGEINEFMSSKGVSVQEIKNIANADIALGFGSSMKDTLTTLKSKNPNIKTALIPSLGGLEANDFLVEQLIQFGYMPNDVIKKWRQRLKDAMLDTCYLMGNTKFLIALEPDQSFTLANILEEVGADIEIVTSHKIHCHLYSKSQIIVGDMEDVIEKMEHCDVVISNDHLFLTASIKHKVFVPRGFPIFKTMGNIYKSDILYEGSTMFLYECANYLNYK